MPEGLVLLAQAAQLFGSPGERVVSGEGIEPSTT